MTSVSHWLPGLELDPRYIALAGELEELAAEIRAVLAPTGFGGIINRARADELERRRARLRDDLIRLKQQFLVRREIAPEAASGVRSIAKDL